MRSDRSDNFVSVLIRNFDILAGPVVAVVYPMYASIRAVENRSFEHCQHWLTYWILYSLITLFELLFAKALELFPIWSFVKLVLSCWLVLPQFNGTAYVYQQIIRPFYVNPQNTARWYVPGKKEMFTKEDDILTAAHKYMQHHGSHDFERIIQNRYAAETRGARSGSGSSFFDGHYPY